MVEISLSKQEYSQSDYNLYVKKGDLKWSSISMSEVINNGYRFEATCFNIDVKNAINIVNNSKWPITTIGGDNGLVKSYRPGICKRIFVDKSDDSIAMLTPSQITEIFPKPEKFLSSKMRRYISNWFVKENEILLTCSGTIGKTTIVTKTLSGKCISQNLIRIKTKNFEDTGYLYAFINTNIGQVLLTKNNYGAVIQHIDPEHLENVPIPNPPKSIKLKINDLIIKSFKLRDDSNELINEATNILIDELKLPPIYNLVTDKYNKNTSLNNFVVKLSNLDGRIDVSYHIPLVRAIIDNLRMNSAELISIGDKRISKRIILPGRFKRTYVEEGQGCVFFGGKQLFELDPSNKKYLSIAKHGKRISDQLELRENMVLVSCSGTIGKVTLVPKHWEGWTVNQHVIRIIPSSNNIAGYLSIFLSTDYGNTLIKRFTYGSVVDEIDADHVAQIQIPILNNIEKQIAINSLALEANEKRYKAYQLEQQAMKIINNEVIFAK